MKKFNIPCDAGGKKVNIDVCIGDPKDGNHPLQNQAAWLSKERGAAIPKDVMDAFQKLLDIARKEKVSFEDLCQYAFEKYGKKGEEESSSDSDQRDLGKEQNIKGYTLE